MFKSIRHQMVKVILATAVTALLLASPMLPSAHADGQCTVPPVECTG